MDILEPGFEDGGGGYGNPSDFGIYTPIPVGERGGVEVGRVRVRGGEVGRDGGGGGGEQKNGIIEVSLRGR